MQEDLFYEDFNDALSYTIKALGGFASVGLELWPANHDDKLRVVK